MRIISKFHDYYDAAQGFGQDQSLIYRRTVEQKLLEHWAWDSRVLDIFRLRPWYYLHHKPKLAVIGFCGRCYPVWLEESFMLTTESLSVHAKTKHWLDDDEVVECYKPTLPPRYGWGVKEVASAVARVRAIGRYRHRSRRLSGARLPHLCGFHDLPWVVTKDRTH